MSDGANPGCGGGDGANPGGSGGGGGSDRDRDSNDETQPRQIQRQVTPPAPWRQAGAGCSGGNFLQLGEFPSILDQNGLAVGSSSYGVSYHFPDQGKAILRDSWRDFYRRISPTPAPTTGGRVPRANLAPLSRGMEPYVVRRPRTRRRYRSMGSLLWGPNAARHVQAPAHLQGAGQGHGDQNDVNGEAGQENGGLHLDPVQFGLPEGDIYQDLPDVSGLSDFDPQEFFSNNE